MQMSLQQVRMPKRLYEDLATKSQEYGITAARLSRMLIGEGLIKLKDGKLKEVEAKLQDPYFS